MKNKKSQTNVEFIIILSMIMILLILVVFIIGDFSFFPNTFVNRQNQRYWLISDIGILGHSFNGTHGLLSIKNNLEEPIIIREIYLSEETYFIGNVLIYQKDSELFFQNYSINEGIYDLDVLVIYSDYEGSNLYSFSGLTTIKGTVSSFN